MKDRGKTPEGVRFVWFYCSIAALRLRFKAVVFLRSRDGGTCDELWLDFAEMWLHLRLVQLQTMPNKVWANSLGLCYVGWSFVCTTVLFMLPGHEWPPRFPDICLRTRNKERHDAKFHDGPAIKGRKATCDTTVAQKRVERAESYSFMAIKCLSIGQYLDYISSLSGRPKGCLWHNIGPSGRSEHGACWKDPATHP